MLPAAPPASPHSKTFADDDIFKTLPDAPVAAGISNVKLADTVAGASNPTYWPPVASCNLKSPSAVISSWVAVYVPVDTAPVVVIVDEPLLILPNPLVIEPESNAPVSYTHLTLPTKA